MLTPHQPPFLPTKDLSALCAACAEHNRVKGTAFNGELNDRIQELNDGDFDRLEWYCTGAANERKGAALRGLDKIKTEAQAQVFVAPDYAKRQDREEREAAHRRFLILTILAAAAVVIMLLDFGIQHLPREVIRGS